MVRQGIVCFNNNEEKDRRIDCWLAEEQKHFDFYTWFRMGLDDQTEISGCGWLCWMWNVFKNNRSFAYIHLMIDLGSNYPRISIALRFFLWHVPPNSTQLMSLTTSIREKKSDRLRLSHTLEYKFHLACSPVGPSWTDLGYRLLLFFVLGLAVNYYCETVVKVFSSSLKHGIEFLLRNRGFYYYFEFTCRTTTRHLD